MNETQVQSVKTAAVVKKPARRSALKARAKVLSPLALIAAAVREHLPVETIERLAVLHEHALEIQAKHEYFDALADMQAELPIVTKTKKVPNSKKYQEDHPEASAVRFAYAPIEKIIEKVGPLLKKHDFSFTFKPARTTTEGDGRWLLVPCTLHHTAGHEETSTFPSPIMSAEERKILGMSEAQAVRAADTFGKRSSFLDVTGIMTMDPESTEGGTGPIEEPKSTEQPAAEKTDKPTAKKAAKADVSTIYGEVLDLIGKKTTGSPAKRFRESAGTARTKDDVGALTALRATLNRMKDLEA